VTLLAESGRTLPEIVSITSHSLRTAQTIIEKYLARTSKLAATAIAKFENVLDTDFAKRPAKRWVQNSAKCWRAAVDEDGQYSFAVAL
jgi:hypothetical protein